MIRFKQRIAGFLLVAFAVALSYVFPGQAKDETPNTSHRFALNFNEVMNRCLQSGCANIEELIGFFSEESSYLDDSGQLWNGKENIRKRFLRTQPAADTSDSIEGMDLAGSLVTLRLRRLHAFKVGKVDTAWVKRHVQIILLKDGRIVRLISVIPPDGK